MSALEYWPSPPPWGWVADDLDRLPADGPNSEPGFFTWVELIDGALVFAAPQSRFHERLTTGLAAALQQTPAAGGLATVTRMDVKLGRRMRLCPDVLVIDAVVADDDDRT